MKIPAPALSYRTRSCLGAMPGTTYCQLRIGLQVSLAAKRATGPRLSRVLRYNLESEECNPDRLDVTASHFPGIGVLSAQ
jgi:hypothetical protein